MASSELIDLRKPADYYENPRKYKPISIVVLSDTHNKHQQLTLPNGDILLHCGDFTNKSDRHSSTTRNNIGQLVIDFNQWLGTLPHRHKIVICCNHESGLQHLTKQEIQSRVLANCHYLKDELIEVEGILIYGSPWPFGKNQRSKWALIHTNIDILMTHQPPKYILDLAYQPEHDVSTKLCSVCKNAIHDMYGHWGSRDLAKEICERIKRKVHCFGYVHDDQGYKYVEDSETMFINAATYLTKKCFQFTFYVNLHEHR